MKRLLTYIAAIALLAGCTERIELDLNTDDNQRLVVEGWFTDQLQKHEVNLTLTTSYFYNEAAPRATGATVTITSEDNEVWTLTEEEPGIYRTPEVAGEPAKWYTLDIDYEGETYTATSWMRPVAPIDSLHVRVLDPMEEWGFPGDPYYSVRIWTQELEGLGDHYMWQTYVNNQPVRDTLRELTFVDDAFYDGIYIEDVEIDYLDIEDEAVPGDTVYIEQYNIGLEAYEIFIGIMNETAWNGGLFDAPPANVETNISNGALGYWGAAGVSVANTVIQE